jgi:negative regulator of genetic competence, sporulation and motility
MRQSDNASRQKIENQLRKEALEKLRKSIREMATSNKIDSGRLREYSEVLVDEELLARIKLLKKHTEAYQSILKLLNDLTSNMTCGVKFHRIEAKTVYDLASGELMWDALSNEEKRSIARNPDYVRAIDNGYNDIVPVLAISRLIDYIRNGKITFEGSYYYQDLGKRIKTVEICCSLISSASHS